MGNATSKHSAKIKDANVRVLVGRKVLYIGDMTCPVCSLRRRKGMVSEYEGVFYCSENCVLSVAS